MDGNRTPLHDLFQSWGADFLCEEGLERPLRLSGAGAEYEAARTGTALADGGDRAWVLIEGGDAIDFLQRTLSSDVAALKEGAGQWSAMLTGKGRWVADLLLFRLPGETPRFGLDLPTARRDYFLQRLEMLHFGENLSWSAPELGRLLVVGPGAEAALTERGLGAPNEFSALETSTTTILQRPDRGERCFDILAAPDQVVEIARALRDSGAVPCGLVALDILRVEAFLPRWGDDFGDEDTLPNSNEWRRASLTKGCYAGQEVVAKINTYGEAPRQLCRLRFDGEPQPLRGAELRDPEGKVLGHVTSWVWSPREECAVGLGVLRRRAARNGHELEAALGDVRVRAVVEVPEKVLG